MVKSFMSHTSDGNMDALRCWWSCFDLHLPHLGCIPSSGVQPCVPMNLQNITWTGASLYAEMASLGYI